MKYPLGLCLSPEAACTLATEPFDFLEVNAQSFLVPESAASVFEGQLELSKSCPKPVRAANCFLPGDLKCVGRSIDWDRLLAYAETAFCRARQAGLETIVFGSGAARRALANQPVTEAFDDFVEVLRKMAPLAEEAGIVLTVEPLNRSETNVINSLAEGAEAVGRCDHPSVRLLADSYHMLVEGEPISEIVRFGKWIRHVHFAELANRGFPGRCRENFRSFFEALTQIEYRGRVSLECSWEDLPTDLVTCRRYLDEQSEGT